MGTSDISWFATLLRVNLACLTPCDEWMDSSGLKSLPDISLGISSVPSTNCERSEGWSLYNSRICHGSHQNAHS